MDLKLRLDTEHLRSKYDRILPKIFSALDHVDDPKIRGQFDCLLKNVYEAFLSPELDQPEATSRRERRKESYRGEQQGQQNQSKRNKTSQFTELLQTFIHDPSVAQRQAAFDPIQRKRIKLSAKQKVEKAEGLLKQVGQLNTYFERALASFSRVERNKPKPVPGRRMNKRRPGASGPPSELVKATVEQLISEADLASLATAEETSSSVTRLNNSWCCLSQVEGTGSPTPERWAQVCDTDTTTRRSGWVGSYVDKLVFKTEANCPCERMSERDVKCEEDQHDEQSTASQFNRAIQQMKHLIEGDSSVFRLNPILPGFIDSRILMKPSNLPKVSPLEPSVETMVQLLNKALVKMKVTKTCWNDESKGSHVNGKKMWTGAPSVSGVSVKANTSSSVSNSCPAASSSVENLVGNVHAMGVSLQDRRMRIDALRNSNAILSGQLAEVEETLVSFDNHVCSVRCQPDNIAAETLTREIHAFQEAMVGRIFSFTELLSILMGALRKTEQRKATKVKSLLAKYKLLKKEKFDCCGTKNPTLFLRDRTKSQSQSPSVDLQKSLKVILKSTEIFQASCEDMWNETINHVFSELESSFASLYNESPLKRWCPDDPESPVSHQVSPSLEEDLENVRKPDEKRQCSAFVLHSLRLLERVSSEFGHLMVITCIRDLQIISIDHSIGLAYIALRQMLLPSTEREQSIMSEKQENKRGTSRSNSNENQRQSLPANSNTKDKGQNKKDQASHQLGAYEELHPEQGDLGGKQQYTNVNEDQQLWNEFKEAEQNRPAKCTSIVEPPAQLEATNAPHMGSLSEIKLPLILHPDSSGDAHMSGPCSSKSSGVSPWSKKKTIVLSPRRAKRTPSGTKTNANSSQLCTQLPKLGNNKIKMLVPSDNDVEPNKENNSENKENRFISRNILVDDDGEPITGPVQVKENEAANKRIRFCQELPAPIPPPYMAAGRKQKQGKAYRKQR